MANPGDKTSSKEKASSRPQENLQGPFAGYTPNVSLSDVAEAVADTLVNPTQGRERREVVYPASGDATTAYANNNDYYIYFYYVPSGGVVGKKESFIKFKAILTDFDDVYVSSWKEESIYGRMDPICTFQSTKRKINFGFDVVAGTLSEAIDNYNKSKALLSYLYPVYEEVTGESFNASSIKSPPLLKIKFANFINEKVGNANLPLVGKLDGLSYRPVMDVGFFENGRKLYPKVNQFTCNFTVLHTQEPVLSVTDLGRPDLRPLVEPSSITKAIEEGKYVPNLKEGNVENQNDAIQAQLESARGNINEKGILNKGMK
mgnify:CR=1 FL=1|tara:strand:- start:845 stop:1795 length:951 start_codon:yes stop_codon:yes gene_type:complete